MKINYLAYGFFSSALLGTSMYSAHAETLYTPLEFRTISGIRPFVYAELNHHRFQLMVHAQADLYAMTTHANAALIGLTNLDNKVKYGIIEEGKVSDLGQSTENLALLEVGDSAVSNVKLQVFEVPQTLGVQSRLFINTFYK